MSVQKASTEFNIPSGTLYGRCRRGGIELSGKNSTTMWSDSDMNMAVESVKTGAMSINQAALSYNMPYSSLYGRISKLKRENPVEWQGFNVELSEATVYEADGSYMAA